MKRGDPIGAAVLGAGPAGLTSALVLARRQHAGAVFEADETVGGLAKTVEFDGYRFDLGGHRFYTQIAEVDRLWGEMLGDEFLERRRRSRIYYGGRFLNYPLRAEDVFRGLGVVESARCAASYVRSRRRSRDAKPESFEDWVVAQFGRRLYETFFRSYTEKVWGIPGSEIRAEWAAQRIQDFNLKAALLGIMRVRRNHAPTVIERFRYPRLGPGQMWEAFRSEVEDAGIPVRLRHRCVSIRHDGRRAHSVVVDGTGEQVEHAVDAVLSSIPLRDLVAALDPQPPAEVLGAAAGLSYRSMVLVALMTSEREPFPDNWIYLHDPEVKAGRVQNFGAWSPAMVRDGTTCLGVEYFCSEGDRVWEMPDGEAVELAADELARVRLLDPAKVTGGVKVRVPMAYPVYDREYRERVATIRRYLERFENLRTFGRNGLHRYNNQDHSMWTALLATLNHTDGAEADVWSVNGQAEYLERIPAHPEGATAVAI